jgi:diguanylate cyclase (GGDEF)-like protein
MNEIDAIIQRLQENEKISKKFQKVETRILTILNFTDLFEVLLTEIRNEFQVPYVWITMIRNSEVSSLIESLGKSDMLKEHINIVSKHFFLDLVGDQKTPTLINTNLKPYFKLLPRNKKFFIKSLAVVPITLDGQVIGSLNQADSFATRFQPGIDTSLLEQLAIKVSLCLSNVTAHEKLKLLTYDDPLTGLLDHSVTEKILKREFIRSKRYATPMSLAYLDIDYLKKINKIYGRDCGDDLLISFADVLRKLCRQSDIVTRAGDDEFAIIMPQTDMLNARTLIDRISAQFKLQPFSSREFDIPVSFSHAIVSTEDETIDRWSLLLSKARESLETNKAKRKAPPKEMGKSRNPKVIKLPAGANPGREKDQ